MKEISLVVAKEIIKSGKTHAQLGQLISHRSHDRELIDGVF